MQNERTTCGLWTIEIRHLLERTIDGRSLPEEWYAVAWLTGTVYAGEFIVGSAPTRAALDTILAAKCVLSDMGSLDPLDVGFDLRVSKMPVLIPATLAVRVRLPRSKKHHDGKVIDGTPSQISQVLRGAGFRVAQGE